MSLWPTDVNGGKISGDFQRKTMIISLDLQSPLGKVSSESGSITLGPGFTL